jgi:hypothetical protein
MTGTPVGSSPAQGEGGRLWLYAEETEMNWNHTAFLMPNKLVFLSFAGEQSAAVIGYVGPDGVCEWPAQKLGKRPNGWQQLLAAPKILANAGS